jgi:hypothetical protein
MPLKGKHGIVTPHSRAIIGDTHQPTAPELDIDLNSRRTGVDGILDKLLYHRRRSLDDLTGRDLVDQIVRQDLYIVHYK